MNMHKVKLTIEDGECYVDLICPETGCEPVTICRSCHRHISDTDTEPCHDCPTGAGGCWLAGWDDLGEYLRGKVSFTVDVDVEWDVDAPCLTIRDGAAEATEEP